MATAEEIAELTALGPAGVDTATLGDLFDARGRNGALAYLWGKRAAETSTLVDTSESGSSRKLSDIHRNANVLAEKYRVLADAETGTGGATAPRGRTRLITR